jgi:hypothetical protein
VGAGKLDPGPHRDVAHRIRQQRPQPLSTDELAQRHLRITQH